MKIDSYSMQASSERSYLSVDSVKLKTSESQVKVSQGSTIAEGGLSQLFPDAVTVSLSDSAKKAIEEAQAKQQESAGQAAAKAQKSYNGFYLPSSPLELKETILERLLYALTGKHYSFKSLSFSAGRQQQNPFAGSAPSGISAGSAASILNVKNTTVEVSHYESERLSYQAQGVIQTSDGRSISIDVSLSMSREFSATFSASYTTAQLAIDPLVINYGGTAASLTGEKFDFDLDADGNVDQISFVGQGSGFLALDKNGDGKINDGTELFGPQSGSGFGELRAYDLDNNGWIDENDEIFSQLRIWCKDKDGNDQLFSLKELDVGAIYLGDISTQYTLGGYTGNSDGTLR
ncbi:MAG: VCBS repeat-containing protein, partial [Clostridiales Family XIII bacterium]|nr:VCBS repeat-containing protein [Clostridiales Family XIII bacterium]